MAKKYKLRHIRNKRSYSFKELADTLGVHVRTVQEWHKSGMPIIPESYPYLIIGTDAKTFLLNMMASKKVTLSKGQCYCIVCRKAVTPIHPIVTPNQRKIGKGKESISITGKCPLCNRKVTRFDSRHIDQSTPIQKPKKTGDKPIKKEVYPADQTVNDLPLFNSFS